MSDQDQWKALSGRIRGLMEAGQLHAHFLSINSGDHYRIAQRLLDHVEQICLSLEIFRGTSQYTLPPAASNAIDLFLERISKFTKGNQATKDKIVQAALVLLGAFESEMSFILSDIQQSIRARSERAFAHLQRLIVADQEFRSKWLAAFNAGETECEKLGAAHLLWHGIFAFKIDARGERTDLVFQEPAGDLVMNNGILKVSS